MGCQRNSGATMAYSSTRSGQTKKSFVEMVFKMIMTVAFRENFFKMTTLPTLKELIEGCFKQLAKDCFCLYCQRFLGGIDPDFFLYGFCSTPCLKYHSRFQAMGTL